MIRQVIFKTITLWLLCTLWGVVCAFLAAHSGHSIPFVFIGIGGAAWLTHAYFQDLADIGEEIHKFERDDYTP